LSSYYFSVFGGGEAPAGEISGGATSFIIEPDV
jgi:hypothetical protein